MTICSDLAEYEWLTGSEAGALLEELAADSTPLHTMVARLRGRFTTTQTHLLMEQTELRRRATAKFTQAHRMFFTRIGLEQATDEWVARHKASRFIDQRAGLSLSNASPPLIADFCCGIGGDLMALAAGGRAIGVDRDNIATHFAAANTGADVQAIDIVAFDFKSVGAFHIDPDRRTGGNRTTSLEWSEPNLTTIERSLTHVPSAAVKLAPACQVPTEWAARCELEWISRDRECRQLVAWHGDLAQKPGQHRATILPAVCHSVLSQKGSLAPRTITGIPKQPIQITEKPNCYVFDIDPAVLAAKLKGVLAAEHQLSALSSGPTYLTGDRPIADSALACFAVQDVLPFRLEQLARYLRARNVGQLEIKKRGVDVAPEKLRCDLKLRGDNSSTLLILPIAGRATAILAQRMST